MEIAPFSKRFSNSGVGIFHVDEHACCAGRRLASVVGEHDGAVPDGYLGVPNLFVTHLFQFLCRPKCFLHEQQEVRGILHNKIRHYPLVAVRDLQGHEPLLLRLAGMGICSLAPEDTKVRQERHLILPGLVVA